MEGSTPREGLYAVCHSKHCAHTLLFDLVRFYALMIPGLDQGQLPAAL